MEFYRKTIIIVEFWWTLYGGYNYSGISTSNLKGKNNLEISIGILQGNNHLGEFKLKFYSE